jgi:hypothetical protein
MTDTTSTEIDLPTSAKPSRLKAEKSDAGEEIVRAAERFEAFRVEHPDGYVEAVLDRVLEHPDGALTYVMHASAYIKRPDYGVPARPDATAWAQGSTKDPNPIIAGSPLESADTIARSRALRNLGILPERAAT